MKISIIKQFQSYLSQVINAQLLTVKEPHFLFLIFLIFLLSCKTTSKLNQIPIAIDVWYGDTQKFGELGVPQKWINVLGNVRADKGIVSLSYSLNGEALKALSIGSDLHRLAYPGDFNVDIDRKLFREGKNDLVIMVKDSANNSIEKKVKIQYAVSNSWPIPYTIEWSKVKRIQDVVQVVDGNWEITADGLHNIDTYYDRVVAIGDNSWKNYEVSTTVTFHSFTPPAKGPPTFGVSHAAIATLWPGHDVDKKQPHKKWYPLGATSEFRLTAGLDSCRWRIFDGPKPNLPRFKAEQPFGEYRTIELNKKYGIKHRVESIDETTTKYSVKLWPADEEEPDQWDLMAIEKDDIIQSGSALLIAHNTNVTFGNVYVVKIKK